MIVQPKFMEDESLFEFTDNGIELTEKGLNDKEVVKEFIEFTKTLAENK